MCSVSARFHRSSLYVLHNAAAYDILNPGGGLKIVKQASKSNVELVEPYADLLFMYNWSD